MLPCLAYMPLEDPCAWEFALFLHGYCKQNREFQIVVPSARLAQIKVWVAQTTSLW